MVIRKSPAYAILTALICTVVLVFAAPVLTQSQPSSASSPAGADASTGSAEPERRTHQFSRQWLLEHARSLAEQPFELPALDEDNPLNELNYDEYRRISFDPYAAIWARQDRNFTLDLFHPGFLYTTPVNINLVVGGVSRQVLYTTDIFRYEEGISDVQNFDAQGYSGFRVYHPINTPDRFEEFLVFQGASYFRGTAKDQFYGLSARGLAINTARPEGEEFPYFTDFWIERPEVGAEKIVIHALLDSPSTTGAFRFDIRPGDSTVMDVEASLFPREEMTHYGIAPLTSMFMFDDTNRSRYDDYRRAVHDSDGLQIMMQNGEQIWRPLANPRRLQSSSFVSSASSSVKGFGLMQRHNQFEDFNDSEARYDKRTSLWIEPLENWGVGEVVLVEIPTPQEVHDNIVAYWQPEDSLQPGNQYDYRYRMHWGPVGPYELEVGRITDTSRGQSINGDDMVFVIDYAGGDTIPNVITDTDAVEIRVTNSAGTVINTSGTLVQATGQYRAFIRIDPGRADLIELRATLHVNGKQWGETWIYRWTQ